MMDAQTETFAAELRKAVLEEITKLNEEAKNGDSEYALESKTLFTELLAKIDSAIAEGADMDEFLIINEIFEARQSTVDRTLEGHADIPFNPATREFIEPKN